MEIQDLNVLIVDDSRFARRKLSSTLKKFGISKLQEAENGEIAIEKINEGGFDVVFLDINMPVLSGIDVVKYVKENNVSIEVFMCSSLDTEDNIDEIKNLGVEHFIYKPFSNEKVEETLKDFLSNH
ncbi:response regulator transcription factor [Candidatus Riflebacteria bacterium]